MSVVGLAGEVVKAPGDRSKDTRKLVTSEVPKMNVKNPQLKVRKPVFTLIRTEKCMYIYHPVYPLTM